MRAPIHGYPGVPKRSARHGEYFAIYELALVRSRAFEAKIFLFGDACHRLSRHFFHYRQSGAEPPNRLQLTRVLFRRYPYAIIYRVLPDRIEILAIAHARRRPGYWRNRANQP
jgi:plasmid stabilization system protein ParE